MPWLRDKLAMHTLGQVTYCVHVLLPPRDLLLLLNLNALYYNNCCACLPTHR